MTDSLPTGSLPTGSLHADALDVLTGWQATDAAQGLLRDDYVAFLRAHDNGMWRECEAGHITGSAVVLDSTRSRVLLTLHPKVGRWLQMGGHCEPADMSLRAAASREALEESGIVGLVVSEQPIRLDRHEIRCRPGIVLDHLDVQYLAIAPIDAVAAISEESLDLRWFSVDDLPSDTDDSVRALISAALQH